MSVSERKSIVFSVGIDAGKAVKGAKETADAFLGLDSGSDKAASSLDRLNQRLDKLDVQAKIAPEAFKTAAADALSGAKTIDQANTIIGSGIDNARDKIAGAFDRNKRDADRFAGSLNAINASAARMGDTLEDIKGYSRLTALSGAANTAMQAFDGLSASVQSAWGKIKGLADSASDYQESLGKSALIFEGDSSHVVWWADRSAESLGLSRKAALEYAATLGNMFTAAGMNTQDAAALAKEAIKISVDLESLNNIATPGENVERLIGAFNGEYDSISPQAPIDADRVKAKAQKMFRVKEPNDSQRQKATLEVIKQGSPKAINNFRDTAGGAANQAKINAARMENNKERAGQALLPALNSYNEQVAKVNKALSEMSPLASAAVFSLGGFSGAAPSIAMVGAAGYQAYSAFRLSSGAATAMGVASAGSVPGIMSGNAALGGTAVAGTAASASLWWLVGIVALIAAASYVGYYAWTENWGGIQETTEKTTNALSRIFGGILKPILKVLGYDFESFGQTAKDVWEGIKYYVSGAVEWLEANVVPYLEWFADYVEENQDEIEQAFSGAWNVVKAIVGGAVTGIIGTIWGLGEAIVGISIWLNGEWTAGWELIKSGAIRILESLGIVMPGKGREFIQGFINGIKTQAIILYGEIETIYNWVVGKVNAILGIKAQATGLTGTAAFAALLYPTPPALPAAGVRVGGETYSSNTSYGAKSAPAQQTIVNLQYNGIGSDIPKNWAQQAKTEVKRNGL